MYVLQCNNYVHCTRINKSNNDNNKNDSNSIIIIK